MKRLVLFVLLCTLWALFEATQIQVKKYSINQKDLSGLKMVFLSDFHYSKHANDYKFKQMIEKTNQIEPDIIILGGDYSNGSVDDLDLLFSYLGQLKAKLGVFVVSGNHDYEPGFQMRIQKLTQYHNFKYLDNRGYWLNYGNKRFKLIGVGDLTHSHVRMSSDLSDTKISDYVIVISHQPDLMMQLDPEEVKYVDLMLSGHTHGGQLTLFGLFAPYLPSSYGQELRTGMKKREESIVIVSNGIGEQVLPMRFFSPPQMVVVQFK
jgi:uncharacterized protein